MRIQILRTVILRTAAIGILTGQIFSIQVSARPINWGGELQFDSVRINDYKRTGRDTTTADPATGTQEIPGKESDAFLQTYLFKLTPEMIVNDHVSLKGELSTGSARGGVVGDDTTVNDENDTSREFNGRFYHTAPANQRSLNVNQVYAEIYSDLALIKVGRFARDWGLGALIDSGEDFGERFFSAYEGFEARFNIGKINITPYWSNINSRSEMTRGSEVREIGIELLYDNPDKDQQFGLLISKRKTGARNELYQRNDDGNASTTEDVGTSDVRLMDFFVKKKWKGLSIGLEVPLVSGDLGNFYDSTTQSNIKTNAYILETGYEFSPNWEVNFDFGQVMGDDASESFKAFYLNPNYHVAQLMFRYNLYAAGEDSTQSIWDSAITNTRYFRLASTYRTGQWAWTMAYIMATADETAQANATRAFHHEQGDVFTPSYTQDDDLGWELDINFDYYWNPNLTLSGFFAYYAVGDYYGYTNTSSPLGLQNQIGTGISLNLNF